MNIDSPEPENNIENEPVAESENSVKETEDVFSEVLARVQELRETTSEILAKVTSLRESMDEFALAGAIINSETETEPETEIEPDTMPDDMSDLDFVIRDED